MVVDDADFGCVSIGPAEHDAPLVIHANRVETPQVALQGLQPIARREPEIVDAGRRIEDQQLPSVTRWISYESPFTRSRPNRSLVRRSAKLIITQENKNAMREYVKRQGS